MIRRPLHRSDQNRGVIVEALRDVGIRVYDLGEPCDIMTLFRGVVRLIELKASSKKKFTPAQIKFFSEWADGPIHRIETVEQAMECHGIHIDCDVRRIEVSDKLIRVELWYEREDGTHYMKRAEFGEAEKWNKLNIAVAAFAYAHNANPNWESVEWETAEFSN